MTSEVPSYSREKREGAVRFSTKVYQGIGAFPDTVKLFVFNTFILLYYNQVLGVDARLVSLALAIAIIFDAITDPLVASISDNLRTRWGRRHPLMLISAFPLGISIYCIFVPPSGLEGTLLFAWLLTFVLLSRGFMTLFFVPWAATAAELSDDYEERTSIMSYRFALGWIIGVSFPLFVYTFVFRSSEAFPIGQLNPAGYPKLALAAALIITGGALATTLLTRREIPYLRQHSSATVPFTLGRIVRELFTALKNSQFRLYFIIVLFSVAITGTTLNINIYVTTFFWGLNTEDLRWFAFSAAGAVLAFPLVHFIQKRWDKKIILLWCSIVSLFDGIIIINLRFLGVLPENGDPLLLLILVAAGVLAASIAVIQGIIGASIVADILDDHELRTGLRQEAMFSAGLSFSGKAMSGFGIILGGFIIALIEFPTGVMPGDVPDQQIFLLGLIVGVIVPLLHLIPISLVTRYKITREEHGRIKAALEARQMEP
ncbi:MAG: GPH family glycoside/pentoside/hexuronide:cation symporter [Flavobacterium sp.]